MTNGIGRRKGPKRAVKKRVGTLILTAKFAIDAARCVFPQP